MLICLMLRAMAWPQLASGVINAVNSNTNQGIGASNTTVLIHNASPYSLVTIALRIGA